MFTDSHDGGTLKLTRLLTDCPRTDPVGSVAVCEVSEENGGRSGERGGRGGRIWTPEEEVESFVTPGSDWDVRVGGHLPSSRTSTTVTPTLLLASEGLCLTSEAPRNVLTPEVGRP